jgi:cytochrome c-type biogenesis protein
MDLATSAQQTIQHSPFLGVGVVFIGGVLTAASPCVLAMIPLMMSFVAGRRAEQPTSPVRAFGYSLVFVAGLSISFVALGMIAALAGTIYGQVSPRWNWVVAAVCVVMGLHLAGVFTIPIPALGQRLPKARGALGALILGLLFGLVSAPCAAPVLVVLLTYLAGSGASVAYGGLLLLVYALGHSVLIVIAGTSMGAARTLIENKRMTRAMELLRRGSGVMIIAVGVWFAYRALG